jgi:hypothetical protein
MAIDDTPESHKALHTSFLVLGMFNQHLLNHPTVLDDEVTRSLAVHISAKLTEFHQALRDKCRVS